MKRLLIVGAGGHGRSVAEAVLLARSHEIVGFLDDAATSAEKIWECAVWGSTELLSQSGDKADAVIVAIGNNRVREALHHKVRGAGLELATVVHPRAFVSPSAAVGEGCAILAHAVVGTEARIGEGVIVNCAAVVDHHCLVEDFAHLGTNACMAGGSALARGAWMQAGSALGYGVRIPPGAVLPPGQGMAAQDIQSPESKGGPAS